MVVVFVPGAGRSGAADWPQQAGSPEVGPLGCCCLEHDRIGEDRDAQAVAITEALGAGGHLVAHSVGAVPALLAAGDLTGTGSPHPVRSLVLFEPACFGAVRGGPEVEAHIDRLRQVFAHARAPDVSDGEFAARFFTALGAAAPDPAGPWAQVQGRRLRATPPPWEHIPDLAVLHVVPTLVVTGGWNALYDEVADGLIRAGARRLVLEGHEHRPQDHPDANTALLRHWTYARV